jgi:hypothetical protein
MANNRVALTRKAAVALGALTVYLRPKLAADAQLDLEAVLQDVTDKNFTAKKPHIISAIQKQVNGRLAKDANIGTLAQLLDALELESAPVEAGPGVPEANPMSGMPEVPTAKGPGGMPHLMPGQGAPESTGTMQDTPMGGGLGGGTGGAPIGMEQLKAFLASKGMHPQDIEQACQMACGPTGPGAGGMGAGKPPPPAGGPQAPAAASAPPPGGGGGGGSSGGEKSGGGGSSSEESSDKAKDAISGLGGPEDGYKFASQKTSHGGSDQGHPEVMSGHGQTSGGEHGTNYRTPDKFSGVDSRMGRDNPEHFPGMPEVGMGPRDGGSSAMDSINGDLNMADKRQIEEAVAQAAKQAIKQAQDQMGAAVKAAVDKERETQRAIREAENDVRPYIGHIAQAFDSAEDIYRTALNTLGVKLDGVHPTAYKVILGLQALPNAQKRVSPSAIVASDSKGASDFAARNPYAAKIEIL